MAGKQYFYAFKTIRKVKICEVVYTDASLEGWGASYGNNPTGRAWLLLKKEFI